jgi:hypothetical protein
VIDVNALKAGDVLTFWHDSGCFGAQACFAKVVRVNPVTVTVETESGRVVRREPSFFNRVLKPHEWSPWNPEGK